MLPDHLVQHPRLQIAARYQAAGDMLEVGGDWYDTFTWPTGHIGVIVGDIVGHNLESAAAMGRLRAATAAVAAHVPPDPAALLDAINHYASGPNGTDFATAVCVVIDPSNGHLAYASAGHPPALLVDASGTSHWLDQAQHPPLTTENEPHIGADRNLSDGCVLVLYSDGLIERRTDSLDNGLDLLAATACAAIMSGRTDPGTLADHLLAALTSDSPTEDDIVLVCLRYRPTDHS
jgi:serine phosphatase RsbU (regulator of sigma subunit)